MLILLSSSSFKITTHSFPPYSVKGRMRLRKTIKCLKEVFGYAPVPTVLTKLMLITVLVNYNHFKFLTILEFLHHLLKHSIKVYHISNYITKTNKTFHLNNGYQQVIWPTFGLWCATKKFSCLCTRSQPKELKDPRKYAEIILPLLQKKARLKTPIHLSTLPTKQSWSLIALYPALISSQAGPVTS